MNHSVSESAIPRSSSSGEEKRGEMASWGQQSSVDSGRSLNLVDSASSYTLNSSLQDSGNGADASQSHPSDAQTTAAGLALAETESQRRHPGRPHLPKLRHRSGPHTGKKEHELERVLQLREVESHRGAGGGAPLSRRRRGRINLALRRLAPSYRSKNEAFKRLFRHELPEDERLIDDYSCALQRDVLVHGRMYVSQNYLCFYANIFGFETLLVVNFSDVAAVTREKTALVIPNALQITMKEPVSKPKYYFFASFISRDTSYMVLFKIWQNVLMGCPMSPQHLRTFACRCWGQTTDIKTGEEMLPSLRDNSSPAPSEDEHHRDDQSSKSSEVEDELEKGDDDDDDLSDADEDEDTDLEVECGCPVHDEPVFLNKVYNISAKALFELLFTPSDFYWKFMDKRKMFDLVIDPWSNTDGEDGTAGRRRDVHFTVTVKGGLGPRFAPSVESQHLLGESKPRCVYRIEGESTNSGVPYGDAFYTFIRYCITRVSRNSSRLRIGACVKYRKKVFSMIRSMIERAANDGMGEHYQELNACIVEETSRRSNQARTPDIAVNANSQVAVDEQKPSAGDGSREQHVKDLTQAKPTAQQAPVANQVSRVTIVTNMLSSSVRWLVSRWMQILAILLLIALIGNIILFLQQPGALMFRSFERGSARQPCLALNPWLELLRVQNEYHQKEMAEWRSVVSDHTQTMSKVVDILQRLLQEKTTEAAGK